MAKEKVEETELAFILLDWAFSEDEEEDRKAFEAEIARIDREVTHG